MQILTRADAYRLGLKKFYTGHPCRNGHIAERYVSTKGCIECLRGAPAEALTKLTFMVDPRDADTLKEYADALITARALTPETPDEAKEKKRRTLTNNLRRAGCPEEEIERMVAGMLGAP